MKQKSDPVPDLLNKDKKPIEPYCVYKKGILLYTIKKWRWVEKRSKLNEIFPEGWFGLRIHNYNHPDMKKELRNLKERQQRILDREKIDWEALNKIRFTI